MLKENASESRFHYVQNKEKKPLSNKQRRKNQSGMSLFETIPLVMVLASLIGFLLGLWGMTHKNILSSIAARNYTFETFNHRANLIYFNDIRSTNHSYEESGLRWHAIGDRNGNTLKAFTTPIRFPAAAGAPDDSSSIHRQRIWDDARIPRRGEASVSVNRAWVLTGYGICLNTRCGG